MTHITRRTLVSKEKQSFPSAFPARETPDETGGRGLDPTEEELKKRPYESRRLVENQLRINLHSEEF